MCSITRRRKCCGRTPRFDVTCVEVYGRNSFVDGHYGRLETDGVTASSWELLRAAEDVCEEQQRITDFHQILRYFAIAVHIYYMYAYPLHPSWQTFEGCYEATGK